MLSREHLEPLIHLALQEDIGPGDVTTDALIPAEARAVMEFHAGAPLVVAGIDVPVWVMEILSEHVQAEILVADGARAGRGQPLLRFTGPARALLTGERVALNFLQRSCGVATHTRKFVDAVTGTRAKILDTRKTMPGMRVLDKFSVLCGGGINHRFGLYDAVMIKDNHIAMAGNNITAAIKAARAAAPGLPIIVECDTLQQLGQALADPPDHLLLDNMNPAALAVAVQQTADRVKLEASGGVTLENVRAIAQTGVDFISVGALTHSAPAADIGADIKLLTK